MDEAQLAKSKVFCNHCGRTTNHAEIAKCKVAESEDDGHRYSEWETVYRMLQCLGCDNASMRADHWHSDYDMSNDTEFYPPRVSRKIPSWLWQLPDGWRFLLREVYTALQADSKRLAMMGARALIDVYMNDTVGDKGNFIVKMQALIKENHLTEQDANVLAAALEAGHAATHRGHLPSESTISHVMDIVENLLQRYALRNSAASLVEAIPPRPSKKLEGPSS